MSLDCSFLIAPSVFPNVYFRPVSCVPGVASVSGLSILDCPFGFLLTFIFVLCLVYVYFRPVLLPVSLDCPFLIVPSVFSNVYRPVSCLFSSCVLRVRPVSCVPGVPVSLDCPFLIAPSV